MAQIPSWLWLGAGIVVVLGSIYVGEHLQFFFYVGLLFIVIGIAKIAIWFVTRKGETKVEREQVQKFVPRQTHPHYRQCRCGQWARKTDNFY